MLVARTQIKLNLVKKKKKGSTDLQSLKSKIRHTFKGVLYQISFKSFSCDVIRKPDALIKYLNRARMWSKHITHINKCLGYWSVSFWVPGYFATDRDVYRDQNEHRHAGSGAGDLIKLKRLQRKKARVATKPRKTSDTLYNGRAMGTLMPGSFKTQHTGWGCCQWIHNRQWP